MCINLIWIISGKSKFNFRKQISYAVDGLMNFSTSLLNGAIVLGTICTTVSFIYFIYIFIKTLVQGIDMPGYASLACLILFFGGIIIAFQGLLAKYIAKVYMEAKERPIYIEKLVRLVRNFQQFPILRNKIA